MCVLANQVATEALTGALSFHRTPQVGFPQEQLHTTPEALHCLSGATGSPTKSPTALSCSATFTTVEAAREELTLHNHLLLATVSDYYYLLGSCCARRTTRCILL
jgi:hypothetical protein